MSHVSQALPLIFASLPLPGYSTAIVVAGWYRTASPTEWRAETLDRPELAGGKKSVWVVKVQRWTREAFAGGEKGSSLEIIVRESYAVSTMRKAMISLCFELSCAIIPDLLCLYSVYQA